MPIANRRNLRCQPGWKDSESWSGNRCPIERTDILSAQALWTDHYNGQILHTNDPKQFIAGDAFEQWLFPLHSGEACGFMAPSAS